MNPTILFEIFKFISFLGGLFIGIGIIHGIMKVILVLLLEIIKFILEKIKKWWKK